MENNAPDPNRLRATIEKLASWHTRNTSTEELTEAANWIADQYRAIPGMQVELFKYKVQKGERVPEDKEVVEVVATLPGDTDKRILIGGHIDTINLGNDVFTSRSPGADDDASGAALALEVARLMAGAKHRHTLVFIAFSGEEQGLFGSAALAQHAVDEKWTIDAFLNNDMVGNTQNDTGNHNDKEIRLFSEDSPKHEGRELARYVEWLTRDAGPVKPRLILRRDRYRRGGDHTSFNKAGFTAMRFTEAVENFAVQHKEGDLPEHVNFNYLAGVTLINWKAAESLANAGDQPTDVQIVQQLGYDTRIHWKGGSGPFVLYWRHSAKAEWEGTKDLGDVQEYTATNMSKDDLVFAIGSKGGIPVEAK